MLKRVYVEITNRCNLACSFCPGTKRPLRSMTAAEFAVAAKKLRCAAKYLYLHVMGEPLLHPELEEILAIAGEEGFRICLTTNGTLLAERSALLLRTPALHRVSVSLHSFEGNTPKGEITRYLQGVWDFAAAASAQGVIVSLRLWNEGGENQRNEEILRFFREKTGEEPWERPRPDSFRLRDRLFIESAERFDWPDMAAEERQTEFCLALRDQIAVLCDGTVTPCCLDHEGAMPLGNLFRQELGEILDSPRAKAIYYGFSARQAVEELCRRCGYAARFNRTE